ncbi:MAG: ABC transporter ATP-binding protein [Gemmatimonadaceae bacterium]|nr:ABC transporter ATP-binding protein [Gemmatimonadaceae bacterium]
MMNAVEALSQELRPAGSEPCIALAGMAVRFGRFTLGPIDLAIQPGEAVALLGANGAGKSTLINALAGRLHAYDGSTTVFGAEVRTHLVETRERVGVLPEKVVAYSWMSVREYLDLHRVMFQRWDDVLERELLRRLRIDPGAAMQQLSRGTRVKVAFIAAAAPSPLLLLLDEPTSGIDPIVREELLAIIRERSAADPRQALVVSTHILEDVPGVANRVLVLREGRLAADIQTSEVLADPHPLQRLREVMRDA